MQGWHALEPAGREKEKITQEDTTSALTRGNELAEEQRPALGVRGLLVHPVPEAHRLRAPRHVLRVPSLRRVVLGGRLHPRGRAPRAGDDPQAVLGRGFGGIGPRDDVGGLAHHADHAGVHVVRDVGVEVVEGEVVLGVVEGVGADGEVAGVDVGAAEAGWSVRGARATRA